MHCNMFTIFCDVIYVTSYTKLDGNVNDAYCKPRTITEKIKQNRETDIVNILME